MVAVETREDKTRNSGRENIDSVPLSLTATAYLMAQYPSTEDERLTKKRPAQNIGYGRTTTETVSQLDYRTLACSNGLRQ